MLSTFPLRIFFFFLFFVILIIFIRSFDFVNDTLIETKCRDLLLAVSVLIFAG